MKEIALIFIGGGVGRVARFSVSKWINLIHNQNFPYGTLVANTMSCLILGFVIGLAEQKQLITPSTRLFWTVGFCGGFSTFSSFSAETISLFQSGLHFSSLIYIIASIFLCLIVMFGGLYLGENFN